MNPPDWNHCTEEKLWHYVASQANFDQAALICRRQAVRVDLAAVRSWCETEGANAVYDELISHLALDESVD